MGKSRSDSILALNRNLARSLRTGRLDEAETILERLRREDPIAVETRGGELELLLRKGSLDEARRLADQLVGLFPGSARIHYLAGRVAYRRRQYGGARGLFEESLRLASHWRVRQWLGKTLTQLGRFDEAEPLLIGALAEHPSAGLDLAWLFERRGDPQQAIEALETFLTSFPNDSLARSQLERLRAGTLDGDRLIEEVDGLEELGEEVSAEVLAEYVKRLVERGELRRVRGLLAERLPSLPDPVVTRIAWACHRAHAPDLAYDLFIRTFDVNLSSVKFLSALESDAVRAGRAGELVNMYRSRAAERPTLWGRARRLESRLSKG